MNSAYKVMYDVQINHSYYTDGICHNLNFIPDSTTQSLMTRYGFKLLNTVNGFSFYTETKETFSTFLNYIQQITGETAFVFEVTTSDTLFYQFTTLPVNQIGVLDYDTKDGESTGTNEVVLKGSFKTEASTSHILRIKINFEDLIKSYENDEKVQFIINLESRETQWRYYIINSSGQHFGTLSIQSTSAISFEVPVEVTLQNGQKALLFSTGDQKIPFKEVAPYQFDLTGTSANLGTNRTKVIFKGLPNANPNAIEIYQEDQSDQLASLMYVYI